MNTTLNPRAVIGDNEAPDFAKIETEPPPRNASMNTGASAGGGTCRKIWPQRRRFPPK